MWWKCASAGGCSPAAPSASRRTGGRRAPCCLQLLLPNERSFMGREIRNVWQLWLEAKALFTEICVLMLSMFSFRSLGQ